MATRYAESTAVPSDRSRAEIEATLRRYGATAFAYGWDADAASIAFELAGRQMRFRLPMPNRDERRFTHTAGRNIERTKVARESAYEQAVRQSWRALSLVIKAKLEAVSAGITTHEQEWLAHIVLPNGATVGDWATPQIAIAYDTHTMPALMPGSAR